MERVGRVRTVDVLELVVPGAPVRPAPVHQAPRLEREARAVRTLAARLVCRQIGRVVLVVVVPATTRVLVPLADAHVGVRAGGRALPDRDRVMVVVAVARAPPRGG